jgi:hypothetical protein
MCEDLAVGQGAIDACAHGAEMASADIGADRCASELEIGQRNAVGGCGQGHLA